MERTEPLKGQPWTRSERAHRMPDVPSRWRALALLAAGAELALLTWLWLGPLFSIQSVQVVGQQHLTAAQVAGAAGLSEGKSLISVDSRGDRQKLLGQLWVRSAGVQLQLPGTVLITVSEWQPVAAYHAGKSPKLFVLSDQAIVLGPVATAGGLLVVRGPAGTDPRLGQTVLDPALLTALVNIQRGLPTLLGQEVASFIFDSCGDLTLIAKRGWKVYFGRVLTPEEFAALHDKLSALKVISGQGNVDYNAANLDYVNVMNPGEPAVAYKAPPTPSPSPTPSATPAAGPAPCT
jgi:POTRA domain, FtsQ-type